MGKDGFFGKNNRLACKMGIFIAAALLFSASATLGPELITNGDFSSTTITGWALTSPKDTSVKGAVASGQYVITRKTKAAAGDTLNYGIQLSFAGLNLEKGKTYGVSFTAKADSDFAANVNVGMNKSPWGTYSGYTTFPISTVVDTFPFEFKMDSASDNAGRLVFDVGFMKGPGKLYLDNISIKAKAGGTQPANELLTNGDFSSTSVNMWPLNVQGKSAATRSVKNGQLEVVITKCDSLTYDIQLMQTGIKLQKSFSYKLSFAMKADSAISLGVYYVGMNKDPWTSYCGYPVMNLAQSQSWDSSQSVEFTMDTTDNNARVAIDLGGMNGPGKAYFDNISLTCTSCNTRVAEGFTLSKQSPRLQAILNNRNLKIAGISSPASVFLYNAQGKMILSLGETTPVKGAASLPFQRKMAKGVYLVKIGETTAQHMPSTMVRLIHQ